MLATITTALATAAAYALQYIGLCLSEHALWALLWSLPAWLLMLTTWRRDSLDRRMFLLCLLLGVALGFSSHWFADAYGLGF